MALSPYSSRPPYCINLKSTKNVKQREKEKSKQQIFKIEIYKQLGIKIA